MLTLGFGGMAEGNHRRTSEVSLTSTAEWLGGEGEDGDWSLSQVIARSAFLCADFFAASARATF